MAIRKSEATTGGAPQQAVRARFRQEGADGAAGIPVTFAGTTGIFTPAAGPCGTAVLFVSPWGLEEMCVRKFWRATAGHLAARGVASLRFDLPGTGDALDPPCFAEGLALWEDSILAAADTLRRLSGTCGVTVIAQGLGAALAARLGQRLDGLAGMALLAPVLSGRLYLRELAVLSRMVDDSLGLAEEQRATGGVSVAGLKMPDEIAAGVRRLDLMALARVPAARLLVAERSGRPGDGEFSVFLTALGAQVERVAFDGYDALVGNPAVSRIPEALAVKLADWAAAAPAPARATPVAVPAAVPLDGGDFRETPVSFGAGGRLFGVLCEPTGKREGASVLFLSTGYDRHAGWGRMTVEMARALGRRGIASLRFDAANVADSPPVPGAPEQVLYSTAQEEDVRAALDFLTQHGFAPVVAAGRCSGAYLAFRAALADPRLRGAVAVNPFTFRWKPGRDVDSALQFGPRALADYGQRALQWATVRRLLRGEIDVAQALANIGRAVSGRLLAPVSLFLRRHTEEGRHVHAAFRTLAERGTRLTLIYSENDIGRDHFGAYFGTQGQGLADYRNVQLAVIPDADHNLTPEHARRLYLDEVTSMARQFSASS